MTFSGFTQTHEQILNSTPDNPTLAVRARASSGELAAIRRRLALDVVARDAAGSRLAELRLAEPDLAGKVTDLRARLGELRGDSVESLARQLVDGVTPADLKSTERLERELQAAEAALAANRRAQEILRQAAARLEFDAIAAKGPAVRARFEAGAQRLHGALTAARQAMEELRPIVQDLEVLNSAAEAARQQTSQPYLLNLPLDSSLVNMHGFWAERLGADLDAWREAAALRQIEL